MKFTEQEVRGVVESYSELRNLLLNMVDNKFMEDEEYDSVGKYTVDDFSYHNNSVYVIVIDTESVYSRPKEFVFTINEIVAFSEDTHGKY